MHRFSYTLDLLHEQERDFAAKQGVPTHAIEVLHTLRSGLISKDAPDSHKLAVWIVAPVLAGFAVWLKEAIRAPHARPLGVMREGRFLCQLMRDLFGIDSYEAHFNRSLCMLAAYDCGDDEALLNWLVRTRITPLTHAKLAKLLPSYTVPSQHADHPLTLSEAQSLITQWRSMGGNSPVDALAQAAHQGVWQYWKKLTNFSQGQPVALMDFACAGNIQRSLQTILRAHDDPTNLLGLNFATTSGTKWAKQQGCDMSGFIANNGEPHWMADAYAAAPELIELFVAAPIGPLMGYTEDGMPVRTSSLLGAAHKNEVGDWQKHILQAAKIICCEMSATLTPELCRCLWGRLVLDPLPAEVMALAEWPVDSGLEDSTPRMLAPLIQEGEPKDWSKIQTGWPAASLLRQRLSI